MSLLVSICGTCFEVSKQPDVPSHHVYEELFIVHLVVIGAVFHLDPGGVCFFALFGLIVH